VVVGLGVVDLGGVRLVENGKVSAGVGGMVEQLTARQLLDELVKISV
jgi:hypothetical protein